MRFNLIGAMAIGMMTSVSVAVAADAAPADTKAAPAVAVTNELAGLKVQEETLDLRERKLAQELISLARPLQQARQKAMQEDEELRALNAEIAAKQAAIEKKLREKHPEVAAKMKEQEALIEQHTGIVAQLRAVRKTMDELDAAAKTKTEKK